MKRILLAVFAIALILVGIYGCESETKVMTHTQTVQKSEPVEVP